MQLKALYKQGTLYINTCPVPFPRGPCRQVTAQYKAVQKSSWRASVPDDIKICTAVGENLFACTKSHANR